MLLLVAKAGWLQRNVCRYCLGKSIKDIFTLDLYMEGIAKFNFKVGIENDRSRRL